MCTCERIGRVYIRNGRRRIMGSLCDGELQLLENERGKSVP